MDKVDLEKLTRVDKDSALDRLDGDLELYSELVSLYCDDVVTQFVKLTEYLSKKDQEGSERQAHSIKSASANVGAERVRAVALEAEIAARSGLFEECKEMLEPLELEIRAAIEALSNE